MAIWACDKENELLNKIMGRGIKMNINYDDDLRLTYEGTRAEDEYYAYQEYLAYLRNEENDFNSQSAQASKGCV